MVFFWFEKLEVHFIRPPATSGLGGALWSAWNNIGLYGGSNIIKSKSSTP